MWPERVILRHARGAIFTELTTHSIRHTTAACYTLADWDCGPRSRLAERRDWTVAGSFMCVFALLMPEINSDAPVQKANTCSGGSTVLGPHARSPPPPTFVKRYHFLMSISHLIHMLAFFWEGGALRFAETERGVRLSCEAVKWEKEAGDSSRCVYTALFCCKNCVYVHCRHNSQCVLKGCGRCRQFFFSPHHENKNTKNEKKKKKRK